MDCIVRVSAIYVKTTQIFHLLCMCGRAIVCWSVAGHWMSFEYRWDRSYASWMREEERDGEVKSGWLVRRIFDPSATIDRSAFTSQHCEPSTNKRLAFTKNRHFATFAACGVRTIGLRCFSQEMEWLCQCNNRLNKMQSSRVWERLRYERCMTSKAFKGVRGENNMDVDEDKQSGSRRLPRHSLVFTRSAPSHSLSQRLSFGSTTHHWLWARILA